MYLLRLAAQIEAYAAIVTTAIGGADGCDHFATADIDVGVVEVETADVGTAKAIMAINTTAQFTGDESPSKRVMFFLKITNEGVASLAVNSDGATYRVTDIHAAGTVGVSAA